MRTEPIVIAQLTDTHISVGDHGHGEEYWAENTRRLRSAIRSLNAESAAPAVVLGTGDLVEAGSPAEYELLAEILADLEAPFWPLPGNHDSATNMRAAFGHIEWTEPSTGHASWSQTVPGSDVTVVGLDTTLKGSAGGYVDAARIDWLASAIDKAEGAVVVAMHHPPFLTGIDWMDALGFTGLESLQEVLVQHPPTRIVAGHFHRSIQSNVGSVPASVGIATTLHVNLDLSNASVPAIINDPIGYQLHCVVDNHTITHTRFIDRASLPRPIQI